MAANIVDSMVVTLSLDPTPFIKGQRVADDQMKKTKDSAVKNAKAIEDAQKNTLGYVAKLTTGFLGLFAVLSGGRGFKDLIEDVNAANAALGRFAGNLGLAPASVSALEMAVERMGGKASDADQALENANRTIQDFLVKGKGIPEVISRMTAQVGGKVDFNHGPLAYLKTLAPIFQRMNAVDPAKAHAFMQELGIPDSVANAMAKYGDGFGKYLDGLQKLAASPAAIKAAQDLQEAFAKLNQEVDKTGSDVAAKVDPAMTAFANTMSKLVEALRNDGAISKDIQDIDDAFNDLVETLGIKFDENGFIGAMLKQVDLALVAVRELITDLKEVASFINPSTADVVKDMNKNNKPLDVGGFVKRLERDPSKSATPSDVQDKNTLEKFENFFGFGKGAHVNTGDTESHRTKSGATELDDMGDQNAAPIKVGSADVSAANPLPVKLIESGGVGSIWDQIGSFAGGGSGGPSGRRGKGGGGSGGGDDSSGGDSDYVSKSGAGNLTKLITEASTREGIDPRIMEGIRAGESGHGNRYDKKDDSLESSWGPFQLNRRRGLGVEFERDTAAERKRLGLGDVRDPRTIPLQAAWVAKYIKRHGGPNGQWMGYHGPRNADPKWGDAGYVPQLPDVATGASGAAALNTISNDHRVTTSSSSNELHLHGDINVNAPNATDANGIAGSISPALARNTFAAYANQGPM